MAKVQSPFLGTWASGSVGKAITCRALPNGNGFIMAQYKTKSGKRHPINEKNAEVFKNRSKMYREALKIINQE